MRRKRSIPDSDQSSSRLRINIPHELFAGCSVKALIEIAKQGTSKVQSLEVLDFIMKNRKLTRHMYMPIHQKLFRFCVEQFRSKTSGWSTDNKRQLLRSFSGFNREILYGIWNPRVRLTIGKFPARSHPMLEEMLVRHFHVRTLVFQILRFAHHAPGPWFNVLKHVNFTRLIMESGSDQVERTVRQAGIPYDERTVKVAKIHTLNKRINRVSRLGVELIIERDAITHSLEDS